MKKDVCAFLDSLSIASSLDEVALAHHLLEGGRLHETLAKFVEAFLIRNSIFVVHRKVGQPILTGRILLRDFSGSELADQRLVFFFGHPVQDDDPSWKQSTVDRYVYGFVLVQREAVPLGIDVKRGRNIVDQEEQREILSLGEI